MSIGLFTVSLAAGTFAPYSLTMDFPLFFVFFLCLRSQVSRAWLCIVLCVMPLLCTTFSYPLLSLCASLCACTDAFAFRRFAPSLSLTLSHLPFLTRSRARTLAKGVFSVCCCFFLFHPTSLFFTTTRIQTHLQDETRLEAKGRTQDAKRKGSKNTVLGKGKTRARERERERRERGRV
ncbi:hypothetical protein B0O80DRAFT_206424 [Mortierella sp. GBAus27b]|nr:hypothetical protein B0O80DRAFT_206424 [Mortierella sp. GBAus27b]